MAFSKSATDEVLRAKISVLEGTYFRVRDYLFRSASQSSATAAAVYNEVVNAVSTLDDGFTSQALTNVDVLSVTCSTFAHASTGTATVTLSVAAPPGGVVVDLASSDEGVFTVPATATVLQGATTATFTVTGVAAGTANMEASVGADDPTTGELILS